MVNHWNKLYELIDTWWDVNEDKRNIVAIYSQELIDTWWDVNKKGVVALKNNIKN